MKVGKLPNEVLEKLVFSNIKNKRDEVITRAGIGEDCAVLDFGKYGCVVSTDPITGATKNIGKLAVHISCNDVASNGAEPIGVLLTILAPTGITEQDIGNIMKEAGEAAHELNVEIIGGHTEITDAVNKVVITSTVIGRQLKEKLLRPKDVKAGDKILMTKMAGVEGTGIIANELEDTLKDRVGEGVLKEAKELINSISVVKEGIICADIGVKYMHDVTEGGILGALWETAKAINKGIIIDKKAIPIAVSTLKICEVLSIDPLKLISSGSLIIICEEEKGELIVETLEKEGINASIIGEVTNNGIMIEENGKIKEISPPESDELYKVI